MIYDMAQFRTDVEQYTLFRNNDKEAIEGKPVAIDSLILRT
jgi:hypothetical protein